MSILDCQSWGFNLDQKAPPIGGAFLIKNRCKSCSLLPEGEGLGMRVAAQPIALGQRLQVVADLVAALGLAQLL
jgi:hypothetical protein